MTDPTNRPQVPRLSPEAEHARRSRNRWLGLALFGFVILVGLITIIRLATGDGVSERM